MGFMVDDKIWDKVSSGYNVLCTTCFDELAESGGVTYRFLAVYPVSWSDWLA